MANHGLSPKQILERTQQHRQAVIQFARLAAKRAVKEEMRAQGTLAEGDCLIVTKLDRLARSTRDLLNTLAEIAQRGAAFKSLGDPWCDTTTPHGRLMLTVLGGLAEFERHLILARTSEGRQRAQQRGVRFGRKPKLTAHQQQEALARRARGEALVDIARSYAVSHSTISRLEATI
jgi:DNA invertase Pin-like site-specific DNA recombinase